MITCTTCNPPIESFPANCQPMERCTANYASQWESSTQRGRPIGVSVPTHESPEVLLVAAAGLDYEDFWFVPEGGAVLIVELPAKDQSYQKNHLEMKDSRSGGLSFFVYFLEQAGKRHAHPICNSDSLFFFFG
jgi:hypothetical protein